LFKFTFGGFTQYFYHSSDQKERNTLLQFTTIDTLATS